MFTCKRPDVSILALNPEDGKKLYGLANWSLQPIQTQQDVYIHQRLTKALRTTFEGMETYRVYAPHVVPASAEIVNTTTLKKCIRLGGDVSLYRNNEVPADGVFLKKGEGFAMSAAGCPIIIATAYEHMIVAHAGRDSLIERSAVMGEPARKHLSIVNAIIEAFKERGARTHEIVMCMQFSIPVGKFEHRFDHPRHGAYNKALAAFIDERWKNCMIRENGNAMFLSLESLFVEQARQAGVSHVWAAVSLERNYGLAHTHDGEDPGRRNLIFVKRNA